MLLGRHFSDQWAYQIANQRVIFRTLVQSWRHKDFSEAKMGEVSVTPDYHSSTLDRQSHCCPSAQNFQRDTPPVPNGLPTVEIFAIHKYNRKYHAVFWKDVNFCSSFSGTSYTWKQWHSSPWWKYALLYTECFSNTVCYIDVINVFLRFLFRSRFYARQQELL